MLYLADQAATIIAKLETITGLNQVDYLDGLDELARKPVVLPAAQLVLVESGIKRTGGSLATAESKWMVLIRAKSLTGPSGAMALADTVLDTLSGLQPVAGAGPLLPDKVRFYNNENEMAGYAVTLVTTHRTAINWTMTTP